MKATKYIVTATFTDGDYRIREQKVFTRAISEGIAIIQAMAQVRLFSKVREVHGFDVVQSANQ